MAAALVTDGRTRNYILGAVAVLALLYAGTRLRRQVFPTGDDGGTTIDILCTKCRARYRASVEGKPPWRCARCGEQTAFRALKCANCGTVFAHELPKLDPSDSGEKGPAGRGKTLAERLRPTCPSCGKMNVGPVTRTPVDGAK
jgi:hypothetical protein